MLNNAHSGQHQEGKEENDEKGKNIKERLVKTKQTKGKANGEGVNKNKDAYGGYSKYYSLTILIVVGMRILFCHRAVAQTKKKRRMNINRQFLDSISLKSQFINLREPVH